MLEYVGLGSLIYTVAKDTGGLLTKYKKKNDLTEEEKLINHNWPEKSGFLKEAKEKGYALKWSSPENVEERILDGYEIMYALDLENKKKYRLIDKSKALLMGKNNLS